MRIGCLVGFTGDLLQVIGITGPRRVKLLQISLLVALVVAVIWKYYSIWNSQGVGGKQVV